MGIIVLPENVANQIAAGEVIERPANVVKELLENSLDAQATCIDIQFRNGGNSFIQISDNGKGMNSEDAELCFKRHATSKLKKIDDLQTIHSFGFRGEALPSIASVAKITLQTKTETDVLGIKIETNDGITLKKSPCTCAKGTTFTIEQLFYNVPVRRKFLKSEATESAHIVNCVRLYAIAYPEVHFTLKQDGRQIFSSPQCTTLEDRIVELWPKRPCKSWIKLNEAEASMQLSGIICPPGEGYANSQEIYVFLNHRPIANTFLLGALRECYRNYLPAKTYPSVFLFIEIPETDVDINVHPTKREVRFKYETKLRYFIAESIRKHLENIQNQPLGIQHNSITTPFSFKDITVKADVNEWLAKVPVVEKCNDFSLSDTHKTFLSNSVSDLNPIPLSENNQSTERMVDTEQKTKPAEINLQFFALWQQRYAFFDEAPYLLVLDCSGAQKRIWYERILSDLKQVEIGPLQCTLFPYEFSLDNLQAACLQESMDYLNFRKICVMEMLQPNRFSLKALPQWVPLEEAQLFVEQLIESIMQHGQNQSLEVLLTPLLHKLLKKRAFDPIENKEQVYHLYDELRKCSNYITDPAGNKLWKRLTGQDLFKK